MVKEVKIDKMDELIEALGGGSGSLPTPTSADNGKVLGVVEGAYALKPDAGVDMTGAQAGQVLTAIEDAGGNIIQGWTTPDDGLPAISSSDNGYVLEAHYDESLGTWAEWGRLNKVKSATYAYNQITYDDKSGTASVEIASGNNHILSIDYVGSNNERYPIQYDSLWADGTIYINITDYQKMTTYGTDGSLVVLYTTLI